MSFSVVIIQINFAFQFEHSILLHLFPFLLLNFLSMLINFNALYFFFFFFLSADMVKNKGFLPSSPSEISIQRHQLRDIIFSLLPACQNPDPDTKIPFKANAIIANPPAYG